LEYDCDSEREVHGSAFVITGCSQEPAAIEPCAMQLVSSPQEGKTKISFTSGSSMIALFILSATDAANLLIATAGSPASGHSVKEALSAVRQFAELKAEMLVDLPLLAAELLPDFPRLAELAAEPRFSSSAKASFRIRLAAFFEKHRYALLDGEAEGRSLLQRPVSNFFAIPSEKIAAAHL
jgi:hypothetical protein